MALTSISFATLYSTAQCVLSVIGSVGVILLFAGIPQLIYSPVVNAPNFLTFVMGALLIITMFLGNILLNYKFRRYRDQNNINGSNAQGTGREGRNGTTRRTGDPEDKPPSYDTILTLDEPPPEYASVASQSQKPPKYEEIVKEMRATCEMMDDDRSESTAVPTTTEEPPQDTPAPQHTKQTITLNKIQEEVDEEEMNSSDQSKDCETSTTNVMMENEKQDEVEEASQSLTSRDGHCVVSDDAQHVASQFLHESET